MEMILGIEISKTIFVLLFFVLPVSTMYVWLYVSDSTHRQLEKKKRQSRQKKMQLLLNGNKE